MVQMVVPTVKAEGRMPQKQYIQGITYEQRLNERQVHKNITVAVPHGRYVGRTACW
jgi:hypothetical protein